jgi:AAHS family 4-hydroxybenzoate transporter-like MFS transporter
VGSALGGLILAGFGASGYFMTLAVPLVLAALATLLVRNSVAAAAGEAESEPAAALNREPAL